MDLYQLRYFLEVARELSFTRAARNLHVSTPAVSRSVALLERSLGRKLLARTKRRVELTGDGDLLKTRGERLYDEIEGIERELAGDEDRGPAELKIGSREMITNYLLVGSLREFRERYGRTRFGLYELGPLQLSEGLKKDQVDFGFYYADIPDQALESRRLGVLRSHVYASRRLFPKASAPRSFKEVARLPFIAPRYFRADPSLPSLDGFPDQRFPRNIQYAGEFLETHRRFVLDGVAAAVLPDLVIAEELKKGLVMRFEGPPISREIYFFKRRGRVLPKAVDLLCLSLQKAIAGFSRGGPRRASASR